ncbi:outer membrane beta-barrel family protein [Hufsiella ginkgonis]|uniref:TonB-dependent receptor n=1 Tax=Hufsiella ginkgonis TaxID=2695274 RepID=A0A7K1XRT3_9SPHI|nr:outer membrane beta-barrel family protein [Hufsiella ginkgonis]MXV13711.1 TonB-dependent receptor [Hufsiella ginkgonis]
MKVTLAAVLLSLCSLWAKAQNTNSINGAVADTASFIKLYNSSVSVLNAKDSTLVKFTRAGANGAFTIGGLPKGKFILLVTYPKYTDYVENFSFDADGSTHDFGSINLFLKAKLLADIMIKGNVTAIKIKGDTTEYNAKAYSIQPNSKVEDLLKQLPGIQVDKDGKITAQGQTVSKVLVDGEEFFGDDPTLVTKNLRGDMVDKVQLYDKKSDQATFTGIDDGVKNKTINIKLKENAKNGYFGKLDGGSTADPYYQGQAMFNAFKAKQKASAYGTIGNTGKTGLGWEDANKYSSGSGGVEMVDGGFMISGGGDDLESFGGRYNGEGLPLARTGGVHYDSKWNNDKETINTNYKIGSLGVEGYKDILNQNSLGGTFITSNSNQQFDNYMFRHKLDAAYTIKLDTTSNLKITMDGTLKNSETKTHYNAESFRDDITKLNTNDRNLTNDSKQKTANFTAFYTKKLKKTGRTLSVNLAQNFNDNSTDGYLKSTTDIYNSGGSVSSTQTIDQYKVTDIVSSSTNTTITYTEPLSKLLSIVFNYSLGISNSSADRKSFNQSAPGKYDVLDNIYSNDFTLSQLSNQGGAIFNYKKDKTLVNFGTRATAVDFNQKDEYTGKKYDRSFLNWYPQASYQYKFSAQKSVRLAYNGNTTQPNLDQVQPVRVNNDPLNITLGNPDLKPSFRNNINLSYNTYKVLSSQSFYISGSYGFTMNPIVNNRTTNTNTGESTTQAVNLDKDSRNYSVYSYIDRKFKGINVGLNGSVNGNTSFNYVNGDLNELRSNSYSIGINFNKYVTKKYDFYGSIGPAYNTQESSLQKDRNNNGRSVNGYSGMNIYLPGKLQFNYELNYEWRAKTQSFNEDFSRVLMNTTLSKKFLKQENLKFSVSGNDIFNQNRGFSRNNSIGLLSQTSYNTIKRYFLFSLAWDFSKMGGAAPAAPKN